MCPLAKQPAFIIFVFGPILNRTMRSNPLRTLTMFSFLLAAAHPVKAQSYFPGLSAGLNPNTQVQNGEEKEKLSDPKTWTEIESERKLFSSTYKTPEGQTVISYSSRPLNYYDDSGRLVPIDPSLAPDKNGGYSATHQPFPTFLQPDGSATVSLGKAGLFHFGMDPKVNGQYGKNEMQRKGNEIFFPNVSNGVDKQFLFYENAIKYNYIVKQAQASNDQWLHFTEKIEFPVGCKLLPDKTHGREEQNAWCGDLNLVSSSGEVVSRMLAPVCYDANKNFTIASYIVREENGEHVLEIRVPLSWINDPSRTFPITVDPLVIGPTSLWINGFMPSCIMPSYNADSIQVTIPAQITVTNLYVTSSFYADPFTPAVMSQGAMYFSTNCGQTQNFTVPNPTGNTPGTAYLDSFDLHTPLMCCYPQSCSQQSFWLVMNLGRTGPSTGCNTTYIRYDPTTTLWPFKAMVVGRTVEAFSNQWLVPNTPICSNNCTITGKIFVRYGVPPYTMTHPWAPGTVVQGTPNGCNTGAVIYTFTLTIPNCPVFCGNATTLTVPPPTVTDACGNTVSGLPSRTVPIKKAPDVTALPTALTVCSGDQASINLSSCIANDTILWYGNSITGTGNISDLEVNGGTAASTVNYYAYATSNGCYSDTITVPVIVDPLPGGDFSHTPDPGIINIPINFADVSTIYAGTSVSWTWDFGDNSGSSQQNPAHTFSTPGTYNVCMIVTTDHGCQDTICKEITVIPADVIPPNVVTPNGDGLNDLLKFKYLEFYPGNQLDVYDRWGALVYEKSSYANDLNASKYSDGTYYYVLKVTDTGKTYKGFFEILK